MELGNIAAVFVFEWKRALTGARFAWWLVLTLFPAFIVFLVRLIPGPPPPREAWVVLLFALVPMLVTMLGTFLWATPAVSTELERKSWGYLAARPNGATAVMIGKYLTAVTWVLPAALIGLTIALSLSTSVDKWRIGTTIAGLTCLSCPAYGAVYLLLGTLFPKRSMAIAVAYTLIFEFMISFIPAMINTLTVQFRIRALLVDWANLPRGDRSDDFVAMALLGNSPSWYHVVVLALYTLALLIATVILIRAKEFSSAEESEH